MVYTGSRTIYTHGCRIPRIETAIYASNHKLALLTFILQIISHFGLHKQTLMHFGNQYGQSKMQRCQVSLACRHEILLVYGSIRRID